MTNPFRAARERAGLSVEQLAEKASLALSQLYREQAEITVERIRAIEAGGANEALMSEAGAICQALGIDLDQFGQQLLGHAGVS